MPELYPVCVLKTQPAAEGLTFLSLDLRGTPLPGTHRIPGQYVRLKLNGVGENYFALASPPSLTAQHFDFLLRGGNVLADALVSLPQGARLESSAPAGQGYPMEKARGKNLLLFATGSGISPIHSVLQQVREERRVYGDVTLFFGARTPAGFAYEQDMASWQQHDGIRVIRTVSQPGETGWPGLTGYVQTHLGEVKVDGALAFLCGQKAMVQGVTDALLELGLSKENIFLNY